MIEKVEFRNFKALRDVSLDLERFTVLVGPNASGKTSVLEGLDYLARAGSTDQVRDVFREGPRPALLTSCGSPGHLSLTCLTELGWIHVGESWPAGASFPSPSGGVGRRIVSEEIELGGDSGKAPFEVRCEEGLFVGGNKLGPVRLLRLDVKRLVAPSYSDEATPHMQPDGEGLPSVLAYLASNRPDEFVAIQEALQEVVPIVREMRFPRAPVVRTESEMIKVEGKTFTHRAEREYWGNSIEFDMEGAPRIPAEMVSEGTMLVLGLLTVVMGPDRPQLVLLDDMDRALHPKAQGDLVALLRKLLDQNPEMQIVATSHSPYLLDHLRPEEVRLTTLKDDGSVACGRLDAHPEFDKWKETMAPGEFWSLVGERWLVEAEAGGAGS
jgi:predicted ATPase